MSITDLLRKGGNNGADATYQPLTPDPAFRGLKAALDAGRSAAFGWTGDSTGNYDGTNPLNPADLRTPIRVAQLLAAAYPNFHVLARHWDATNSKLGPALVVQAASAGQRYANMTVRSLRWRPGTTSSFASGNFDIRALCMPSEGWTTGAGLRMIAARRKATTDGTTLTTAEQFRFGLNSDGKLRIDYSTNGTSLDQQNKFSSAAVTGVNGTPMWLRATGVFAGGNYTFTFYQSAANDGATWTQVGTPTTGTAAAMFDAGSGFLEIGAESWQPSSGSFNGRIYEIQIRDGVEGPTIAPCLPEMWEQYGDGNVTFAGAPTLYLINTSISGSKMSDHSTATQVAKETPNYGQTVELFNDSHNESNSSGPAGWTIPYAAWVALVQARLPRVRPVIVLQNPHSSLWTNEAIYGQAHPVRLEEARDMAVASGWGIVDLFGAFTRDSRGLATLLSSDGFHPSQVGYDLAARTTVRRMGINV